jgi:hypothetical protein
MGYTFVCDDCHRGYNHFPPFAGEFTEEFLKATEAGGRFAEVFDPGQKVTICADCMERVL